MPIAATLPEFMLVVAVALLLVVLLVNVQLYQNGHQARSFALNLPVVANPVVSAIDWLISFNLQAARLIDTALEIVAVQSAQALANLIVTIVNIAAATLIALIHSTAQQAGRAEALAIHIEVVELVAVRQQLAQLAAEIGHVQQVETAQLQAAVAAIERTLATDLARALAAAAVVERQLAPYLPMLARLAELPQDAAQTILRLLALTGELGAAVAVLEAQAVTLESGVSALERSIANQQALLGRLAILLTLAAAGAVAIQELVRIARNPCEVCQGLNINDLEARVASVELEVA